MLGPVEFIAYIADATDVADKYNVDAHMYADDGQMLASCRPDVVSDARRRVSNSTADFISYTASRRLQHNTDKTEAMWVGSKCSLHKLSGQDTTLTVGTETIHPVTAVRDLGVWLDSELSLKRQVAKVASACFYQLRRLRQLRRRVGREVTTRLVLALFISRLDYCNSVYAGLPDCTLNLLLRVQNALARLIFQLKPRDHISSCQTCLQ